MADYEFQQSTEHDSCLSLQDLWRDLSRQLHMYNSDFIDWPHPCGRFIKKDFQRLGHPVSLVLDEAHELENASRVELNDLLDTLRALRESRTEEYGLNAVILIGTEKLTRAVQGGGAINSFTPVSAKLSNF